MLFLANGVTNPGLDATFAVLFAVLSVAVVFVAVFLIVRLFNRESQSAGSFASVLAMVIGIGVVLRLLLTFLIKGYREDLAILTGAMEHVAQNGFGGYYADGGTLFPIPLLLYGLFGVITGGMGVTTASVWMQFFAKLPLVIADAVTALILYKVAKKYVNVYVGLVMAGLFSVCPVFMLASGVWGSLYSLLTMELVLALYLLTQKNYLGLIGVYSLSLLTMKDAIYLFPLVAVFVVYNYIKACVALKKKESKSIEDIWDDKETAPVIRVPIYIVVSTLLMYLVSLPVVIKDYGAGFFKWIYTFFLRPLVDLEYFGFNALGIFNIFDKNGDKLGGQFPTTVFVVIFGVLILAIVLLIYLSKKNRANLVLLGAYCIMTLATYFVDYTAMTLVPVLGLLLLAFILIRDKRILHVFGLVSLMVVVNATTVLISAGYLGNAIDSLFDGNALYTGTVLLDRGFNLVMSIVCSVITVLSHLYFTLVMLDVSVSNKRKLLGGAADASFGKSVRMLFK